MFTLASHTLCSADPRLHTCMYVQKWENLRQTMRSRDMKVVVSLADFRKFMTDAFAADMDGNAAA